LYPFTLNILASEAEQPKTQSRSCTNELIMD
jgi:hypothetical protein